METKPSAESVKTEAQMTEKEKAVMHLAQGKRHLLVKDYYEAVGSLAIACELLAKEYGETANECGDAYFNYGKALLGLAREENNVLGDAVEERDGNNEDEGEEDEDNDNEEMEANADSTSDKEEETKTEIVDNSGPDDSKDKVKESTSASKESEQVNVDSGDGEAVEEDESNLKLAWDILELVKIIFQRQADNDKQINLKLSEVYMYLGEIGLESENYTSAIEDIHKCLEIRKELLKEDDRCIAETLYQLGLAHSLASNFDDSIKYFTEAAEVLELRIKNLESKKGGDSGVTEEPSNDAFYTVDGEISEIKSLIPEIKEKIADMQDFKKETLKAIFEKRCENQQENGECREDQPAASSSSAEVKPVSNITHLVRKKRKLEEDLPDSKRSKPDTD